eukprot:CAMPEP_0196586580 /NCGR_PEP_ID=MMETSP1081-20130531/54846_1 /TAXON_ID=36882 /ORGANISM="Pyramimonas amylifera, Strain CCMP720" /LENGTH=381 /DNA_ID=CAMNT_0041908509 /DNA_START=88 /DNA_END=1234 /DNA_ORIENTATION=+
MVELNRLLRPRIKLIWILLVIENVDAKIALFASGSGVTPPVNKPPKIWLYTSVAADYDGALLLPHFLDHYLALGVRLPQFLVVVNHNPLKLESKVDEVVAVLVKYGVKYRMWLDQYSSEKLMKIRYEMLNQAGWNDWIIHADSDEFHDYGMPSVVNFLAKCDEEGVNEVKGTYVDRVSTSGNLTSIESTPDIFKQYPMKCQVIKTVAGGRDTKAMAYKGFWRTDRGNHQVLRPAKAMTYLSGSPGPGLESGRGIVDGEDLYSISPYARYPEAYSFLCQQNDFDEEGNLKVQIPPGIKCFTDKNASKIPKNLLSRKSKTAIVHHFKWHSGVISNVKDRLQYYKGDAIATVSASGETEVKPRYDWYTDSEKLLNGASPEAKLI